METKMKKIKNLFFGLLLSSTSVMANMPEGMEFTASAPFQKTHDVDMTDTPSSDLYKESIAKS